MMIYDGDCRWWFVRRPLEEQVITSCISQVQCNQIGKMCVACPPQSICYKAFFDWNRERSPISNASFVCHVCMSHVMPVGGRAQHPHILPRAGFGATKCDGRKRRRAFQRSCANERMCTVVRSPHRLDFGARSSAVRQS
eukprot:352354-Chlamydomonas_euryale.AAC.1